MSGSIFLGWVVDVIMAIGSIVLLMGKGSFLIAGFNTSRKEEKEQYNVKRLCRVVGGGFGIITIMLGISLFYNFEVPKIIDSMIPWGLFVVIVLMLILSNTVCRKK